MDYSLFYFGLSALYMLFILFSIVKNRKCKAIICASSRFKLLLLGLLISILLLMFLCSQTEHCNGTYCIFFVGFVPLLIFYYCLHLVIKTVGGLKKLLKGEEFDEMLSLFFLFPYVPTFVEIFKMLINGNIITGIHQHETHIFIVTMFLLLDLLSSFFENSQPQIEAANESTSVKKRKGKI
jgi:hypothetical protein